MCPNCNCEHCRAEAPIELATVAPYRCPHCETVDYKKVIRELAPDVKFTCKACKNNMEFVGFTAEELDSHIWRDERYKRLQEDHNWAEYGAYNPHAVPQRGTPAWDKYMKEGRIKTDPKTGMDALYSKDYNEYKRTIKDLGYINKYGDGEINKSRQDGEHYRE